MKNFLIGVLVTVLVPLLGALIFFKLGLMAVNADATPGWFEKRIASMSLNAAVARNAPRVENPIPVTDESLKKGMKLYKDNCAGCHGGPDGSSDFGLAFYPAAPQFVKWTHPLGDPDPEVFYIVKHGVRMTGMPSFGSEKSPMLKDDDIWTLVRFLKAMTALPPAVEQEWKAKPAPTPSASPSGSPGPAASGSPAAAASGSPSAGASGSPAAASSGQPSPAASAASKASPSGSPSGEDDDT